MNGIEDRLARDVACVMGDVVVTDSELREARLAVAQRVEVRRQRDRRRTRAVAAAAAAVLVPALGFTALQSLGDEDRTASPAGPGTGLTDVDEAFLDGTPPTPDDVRGLWRVDNGTLLILFGADGRLSFDNRGRVFSDPAFTGTYAVDGSRVTATIEEGPSDCAGQELVLRASLAAPGELRFVESQAPMHGCFPAEGPRGVLEQVLPTRNEYLRTLGAPSGEVWRRYRGEFVLTGDWMAKVGYATGSAGDVGNVLELAPDGSFTVAGVTGEVIDRGGWTLDPPRRIVLTSADGSPSCEAGDRLILDDVRYQVPGTIMLTATPERNDCGGAWAEASEWILLPDMTREVGSD